MAETNYNQVVTPEHPATAFFMTNQYHNLKHELSFPNSSDKEIWTVWRRELRYPVEPAFSLTLNAYRLLGAEGNIELDLYDGGHKFHGVNSIPWMVKHLA